MRFLSTIVSGAIIGALGVYFTLDWQEEKLEYSITAPAKFGEINYQNLTISNRGWNPAINLKVFIDHPNINFGNVQSSVSLKKLESEKNGIASIERIRRDESIIISTAYEGQPLFGTEVKIASDRSIAQQVEIEDRNQMSGWAYILASFLGGWFVLGILAGIAIPAYRDYVKRAKEVEARVIHKQTLNN